METRPEQDTSETIEARLRNTAPALPPELRPRVLQQCRNQRRTRPTVIWFGQWRPAGALAGLVIFCWAASNRLDAQSQAMITGGSRPRPEGALAVRAPISTPTEADSRNFGTALRWRLRQLTLLLHDKHSG